MRNKHSIQTGTSFKSSLVMALKLFELDPAVPGCVIECGTWKGGKEKAPAAICRKVAEAENGGEIEVWGDGKQTRSFLFIDECIEAIRRLMNSDFTGPVNVGSEEMIAINDLVKMVAEVADKVIKIKNIPGPTGVRGRNSDNKLIKEKLNWAPSQSLVDGISKTYQWINSQRVSV